MLIFELFAPAVQKKNTVTTPTDDMSEGMGFLGEKPVQEAGSPAQQAAIAIAMKKAGKKPHSVKK